MRSLFTLAPLATLAACAAVVVPDKYTSEQDPAHDARAFFVARGMNADLAAAEEQARGAVSTKITSTIKTHFTSLVSELSADGVTHDKQELLSSVESSSQFGHAELIDVVGRFHDTSQNVWYVLAALEKSKAQATLEDELRAPLLSFDTAYAAAADAYAQTRFRNFFTRKKEVQDKGAKAIGALVQIAAVAGKPRDERQAKLVARMEEISQDAVALKDRTQVIILTHAQTPMPGVDGSVLEEVVSQAMATSGIRVSTDKAPPETTAACPSPLGARKNVALAYVDLDTQAAPSDFGSGMFTARTQAHVTILYAATCELLADFVVNKQETKEVMPSAEKAARKAVLKARDLVKERLAKSLNEIF